METATVDLDMLLYQAALMGWVDESLYPEATPDCPNPYERALTLGPDFEVDFRAINTIIETLTNHQFDWRELIRLAMKLIPFNEQRIRNMDPVEPEVLKAAIAVWFLTEARSRGILNWSQIKSAEPIVN